MEQFDPKEKAQEVEHLGYNLLHGYMGDTPNLGLNQLTKTETKELCDQLAFDNWKPNTMPHVDVQLDSNGQIIGVSFKPSFFDMSADASFTSIGTNSDSDQTNDGP